jgi:hypothetical protein
MKWTPKDPVCEMCIIVNSNRNDGPGGVSNSSSSTSRTSSAPMQAQIIIVNSWKVRKVESSTATAVTANILFLDMVKS